MEFIHQAKLMRHHKCIFECVKSIGANCYSWRKRCRVFSIHLSLSQELAERVTVDSDSFNLQWYK